MNMLKSYLPVVVAFALQLAVFVLCNYGVITDAQAMLLMGTFGTGSTAAALHMPQPKTRRKPPGGGLAAIVLCLALTLTGCGALRSLNDARLQLCDLVGEQQREQIRADADRAGIGFAEALAIWKATCLIRVQQAEQQAAVAGSYAIRAPRK